MLVIDAEGGDCAILRSMISACTYGGVNWPRIIRFETRGHGDFKEDSDVESAMVTTLQNNGYLVLEARGDTTLVHIPTLAIDSALRNWVGRYFKLSFWECNVVIYPSSVATSVGVVFSVTHQWEWWGGMWWKWDPDLWWETRHGRWRRGGYQVCEPPG